MTSLGNQDSERLGIHYLVPFLSPKTISYEDKDPVYLLPPPLPTLLVVCHTHLQLLATLTLSVRELYNLPPLALWLTKVPPHYQALSCDLFWPKECEKTWSVPGLSRSFQSDCVDVTKDPLALFSHNKTSMSQNEKVYGAETQSMHSPNATQGRPL